MDSSPTPASGRLSARAGPLAVARPPPARRFNPRTLKSFSQSAERVATTPCDKTARIGRVATGDAAAFSQTVRLTKA